MKKLTFLYLVVMALTWACNKSSTSETFPPLQDCLSEDRLTWTEIAKSVQKNENENFTLYFDQRQLDSLKDEEKAALGYVLSFVGNECQRDYTHEENLVACSLALALGLGYQCRDQHLNFLKYWFRFDKESLEGLEFCYETPNTATLQTELSLLKMAQCGRWIIIDMKADGMFLREDEFWEVEERFIFEKRSKHLFQLNEVDLIMI
jgi:hypothetical protein